MSEFPVIFSLTVVGSLVGWSTGFALRWIGPKAQGETSPPGPRLDRGLAAGTDAPVDPVTKFGFILACNGIIVLALVSALPGALPLERTGLAFALLGVGGLIGEISSARAAQSKEAGGEAAAAGIDAERPTPHRPASRLLSVALALALNLGVAVLCDGQDLIAIVPPKVVSAAHVPELDPVIVIAQRTYGALEDSNARF